MHPDSPQSDISINSITLVELHKHKMNVQQKTGQMSPETGTEQTFIGKKTHVFCGSYTAEARRKGSTVHHLETSLHLHTGEEKPYNML